CMQGLEYPLIF
nr:immunoglobulin light chain junction region [Macaca mulatta]MOX10338.1 immunoglobulin light chain junction region [Macaca mulatta]